VQHVNACPLSSCKKLTFGFSAAVTITAAIFIISVNLIDTHTLAPAQKLVCKLAFQSPQSKTYDLKIVRIDIAIEAMAQ
jgi:hypothetical protein